MALGWSFSATVLAVALFTAACGGRPPPPAGPDTVPGSPSATTVPPGETSAPASGAPPGSTEETVERVAIAVSKGVVVGGVKRVKVRVGTVVALEVSSDAPGTVHVHGFEHKAAVAPGTPASLVFTVDFPGQFEVEIEESGLNLARLEVTP